MRVNTAMWKSCLLLEFFKTAESNDFHWLLRFLLCVQKWNKQMGLKLKEMEVSFFFSPVEGDMSSKKL